jgi:hypothetical protein
MENKEGQTQEREKIEHVAFVSFGIIQKLLNCIMAGHCMTMNEFYQLFYSFSEMKAHQYNIEYVLCQYDKTRKHINGLFESSEPMEWRFIPNLQKGDK